MATNTLKTRIQHKNGLPAEWEQATNFVPLKGELIVYNDATAPKIKIGDGSTLVGNLPFVGASDSTSYLPLTGGTVTADLKAQGQFQTQSTSTHQYPGLWFRNDENADIGAVYMKPSSNNNLNLRWKRDDGGGDGFYYLSCKAADGSVTAPKFVGPLEGTATKATQDGNGNVITSTYLPLAGGTLTGALNFKNGTWNLVGDDCYFGDNDTAGGFAIKGANGNTNLKFVQYNGTNSATITYNGSSLTSSAAFYGAVWNDYAEFRDQLEEVKPGYIVYGEDDGKLRVTTERLQKFEGVVSDTFGFAIGETDECKTPIAVSGRVLVYADPEDEFHSGDCVCAGPDGLAYRMTREEIIEFPDRIVGVVSEIPTYETWGTGNVEVNGRIWIKVK